MTPGPSTAHQQISSNLLEFFFIPKRMQGCEVFHAPFDVRLFPEPDDRQNFTVVQPDLCLVFDLWKLDSRGCVGAPDLIVEITSPSSYEKDTTIKFDLYERAGVKEYWIVVPEQGVVRVYHLRGEKYHLYSQYHKDQVFAIPMLNELLIDLQCIFPDELKMGVAL